MGNDAVVTETCRCTAPAPVVRADRKGAARTYCVRCGLPMRIEFGK